MALNQEAQPYQGRSRLNIELIKNNKILNRVDSTPTLFPAFLIEDDTIQDGVKFEKPKEVGDNIVFRCNNKEIEGYITMITTNSDFENYTICCLRQNNHLELIRGDLSHVKEYYVDANDYLAFLIEDDTIQDGVKFEKPKEVGDNIVFRCNNKEIEGYITMITTNSDFENYTICCLRQNNHLELIRGDLSGLRNCFTDEHGNPVYYSDEDKFVPVCFIGRPIRLEKHNYISRCLRKATINHSYFELEQIQICLVLGDNYSDSIRFVEIDVNAAEIELPEEKSNFIKKFQTDLRKNKKMLADPVEYIFENFRKESSQQFESFIRRVFENKNITLV
ncbi:hypothetical protein QE152_g5127 [Popillia japonica]|uniref:Uncharacterized protein n=1 Tax=Popillia japonica TaxID=7064 RepID=A0AAW1MXE4_POPJA